MTEKKELHHSLHSASLGKCALQGAGIALVLVAIFPLIAGDIAFGIWLFLPLLLYLLEVLWVAYPIIGSSAVPGRLAKGIGKQPQHADLSS